MDSINSRISNLIKQHKKTKTWCATQLNVTPQFISSLCNGKKTPSDRTIADICRIFNVREKWLRDGEMPMFLETDPEPLEELLKMRNIPERDLSIVKSVVKAFLELDQLPRNTVIQFVQSCAEKLNTSANVPATNVDLEAQVAKLEQQNQELMAKLATTEKENAELKATENLRSGKEKAAALYGEQNQTEEKPDAPASSANGSAVV